MPQDFGAWSLLPPILAIVLAIVTRQVFVSLAAGVWIGHVIMTGSLISGTGSALNGLVEVFADADNTRVILFGLLVGSLIALVQRSGGVAGFVQSAQRRGLLASRRRAGLFTMIVGACVFIESNMSILVTGTVGRPIFDRLKISREKLAFVCDSSCAPVCILIPLNGWGAYILAQLTILDVEDPVTVLVASIPMNFYALSALILVVISLAMDRDIGPMKKAQERVEATGQIHGQDTQPLIADEVLALESAPQTPQRALNFVLPIAVMIVMLPVGLMATGLANLPAQTEASLWNILRFCSGSTAVLWSVSGAVLFAWFLFRCQRIMKLPELVNVSLKGAAGLLPLAVLMMLAFAIGELCGSDGLATGNYVSSLVSDQIAAFWIVPLVFFISSGMAFSTGTSWGTFAIMLAIAVPLSTAVDIPLTLLVAAVLGGGVFGDHCSPISDTTVVSSMAAATDHIEHVRTQLPYAVGAGLAALVLYVIAGVMFL